MDLRNNLFESISFRAKTHQLFRYLMIITVFLTACSPVILDNEPVENTPIIRENQDVIYLPEPLLSGNVSIEETLANRRSVRSFQDTLLTEQQIGQLLWAAQGVSDPSGLRTAPSAGATYPLEVYAAIPDGLFRYEPENHSLIQVLAYDPRPDLYQAALRQSWVRDAPLVIVITADYSRTSQRYGPERTPQYVHLEAGHAAQNILLQAVALGLGTVPVGAFYDDQVIEVLTLPASESPLYLIPVGKP